MLFLLKVMLLWGVTSCNVYQRRSSTWNRKSSPNRPGSLLLCSVTNLTSQQQSSSAQGTLSQKQRKFLHYLQELFGLSVGFFSHPLNVIGINHTPTSLKASVGFLAAWTHLSSAGTFFTWKPIKLPLSRCKVLPPSGYWADVGSLLHRRLPENSSRQHTFGGRR